MKSNEILKLYEEVCSLKPLDFGVIVEERLDKTLKRYEETLQSSFLSLKKYDYFDIMKEVNKDAKFD